MLRPDWAVTSVRELSMVRDREREAAYRVAVFISDVRVGAGGLLKKREVMMSSIVDYVTTNCAGEGIMWCRGNGESMMASSRKFIFAAAGAVWRMLDATFNA